MLRAPALFAILLSAGTLSAGTITCLNSSNGVTFQPTACATATLFNENDTLDWKVASPTGSGSLPWTASSANGLSVGVYSVTAGVNSYSVLTNGQGSRLKARSAIVDSSYLSTAASALMLTFDQLNAGGSGVFTGLNAIGFYLNESGGVTSRIDPLLVSVQITAYDVNDNVIEAYRLQNGKNANCLTLSLYGAACADAAIGQAGGTSAPYLGIALGENQNIIRKVLIELSSGLTAADTKMLVHALHLEWAASLADTPVPEPSMYLLIGGGFVMLGLRRWRTR